MRIGIAFILLFVSSFCIGQSFISNNELIVTITPQSERVFQHFINNHEAIKDSKLLSSFINAYLLKFNDQVILEEMIDELDKQKFVQTIEFNCAVESRDIPNDEFFTSQWALDIIQADLVWDITKGGVSGSGQEIVVAVIDDGFDIDHEDLNVNLWKNKSEIAGNGIDDDNNGYIDDVNGWNFDTDSDEHIPMDHGTSVAGIIGAKGDNLIGISGVNQSVKLLYMSKVNMLDEIIEAYSYVAEMRKKFNETDGLEGAYIVATNFSAGIPMVFGFDYPSWCSLYDVLGSQGILSATAADNDIYNVDIEGDMPTTCQSEYLITVTNTDVADQLDAAFGSINVDLGAPGDGILTTEINDAYGTFPGTSAATPHVAGAIALLHSVPCEYLTTAVLNSPSSVASSVKAAILNSTDKLQDLQGVTVSGGRLNLFDGLKLIQELCGGSSGDLFITHTEQDLLGNIKLKYETPDFKPYDLIIYDAIGRFIYKETITPPAFGEKALLLESRDWIPGIYFYTIYNESSLSSGGFFKR